MIFSFIEFIYLSHLCYCILKTIMKAKTIYLPSIYHFDYRATPPLTACYVNSALFNPFAT